MSYLLGDETEMGALCTVALFDLKKKKKRIRVTFSQAEVPLCIWVRGVPPPPNRSDSVACDVGINHHGAGTPPLSYAIPFGMSRGWKWRS